MAKYGSFVYSTAKYGTDDAGAQPVINGDLQWMINIAWTGSFDGSNEAAYAREYHITRGRHNYVAPSGGGFVPMQPGRLTLLLENVGGRYDPGNASSPLYPNVKPGRKIRVSVKSISAAATYQRFYGRIEDIRPVSGRKYVEITAVDDLAWLDAQNVTVPDKIGTNITEAINTVLGKAGATRRVIQSETQPMIFFSADDENAAGVVQDLADASLGTVFVDATGKFRYYTRALSGMATHTIDQAVVSKEIQEGQPWDNLRNSIVVYANRWVKTNVRVLWTSPGGIKVAKGTSVTFDAQFNNPSEPIQPVVGVDYFGFQEFMPSGSWFAWVNVLTASISNISSRGCTVTITNASDSYDLVCKSLTIRGREYLSSGSSPTPRAWGTGVGTAQEFSTKVKCPDSDATSIADYGRRSMVLDNQYLQDANYAKAFAAILKNHFKDPTKILTVSVDTRPATQFPPELMDKIAFTSSTLSIDQTFYVCGIEERWQAQGGIVNGQSVLTTFYLHDCLADTTTITPEELIIVEIPEEPDPTPGDGSELPPEMPTECAEDYAAPINGPYRTDLYGWAYSYGEETSLVKHYPCIIRSVYHQNHTEVQMYGKTELSTDGNYWTSLNDWSWVTAVGMDANGNILTQVKLAQGGNGFLAPEVSKQIAFIGIVCDQGGSVGDVGSVVATGAVDVHSKLGTVVTASAVPGNWYAIRASGGPEKPYYAYSDYDYGGDVDYGAGWKPLGAYYKYPHFGGTGFRNPDAVFVYWKWIDTNYTLCYFQALSSTIKFKVWGDATESDGVWTDNGGSLDFILYNAVEPIGYRRAGVTQMSIRNICPIV